MVERRNPEKPVISRIPGNLFELLASHNTTKPPSRANSEGPEIPSCSELTKKYAVGEVTCLDDLLLSTMPRKAIG